MFVFVGFSFEPTVFNLFVRECRGRYTLSLYFAENISHNLCLGQNDVCSPPSSSSSSTSIFFECFFVVVVARIILCSVSHTRSIAEVDWRSYTVVTPFLKRFKHRQRWVRNIESRATYMSAETEKKMCIRMLLLAQQLARDISPYKYTHNVCLFM